MITQYKQQRIASLIALGALTFAIPVSAQEAFVSIDVAQQINSANELVRQGEFDKAIEEYQRVTPVASDCDKLNYNQAVAKFRTGDFQSASDLFSKAAKSSQSTIAAKSRYNLGNCAYSTALKMAEQDQAAAVQQLREAISYYRDSLRLNDDNADARANIELAAEMIRKLQEMHENKEQQQQEQQQQDQQSQDSRSQPNNKQDQDQQRQNQTEESNSDQKESDQENSAQQSGTEQSGSKQSMDEQNESEGEPSGGSESEPDKTEQNARQNESDQNQASNSESGNEQSQKDDADNQSQQQNPEIEKPDSQDQHTQASEQNHGQQDQHDSSNSNNHSQQNQRHTDRQSAGEPRADEQIGEENEFNPVPAGQLSAAGEHDENEKPNGAAAIADKHARDGLMTKEEAMKMLQAVRDRDMLRRLRQQQLERSRHVPVEKDW